MIEAFLTGLVAKVNETTESVHNDFYNAIGGRFHDTESYQRTDTEYDSEFYPYAVVGIVDSIPGWTFTHNFETITFQIDIFAQTSTDADDAFGKLVALLDPSAGSYWVQPTVTGYTVVSLKRTLTYRDKDDDDIWYYNVRYEAELEKSNT